MAGLDALDIRHDLSMILISALKCMKARSDDMSLTLNGQLVQIHEDITILGQITI